MSDAGVQTLEQPALYTAQEALDATVHRLTVGSAAVVSTRCPGKETPNEDAAALIPFNDDAAVLVVADGVGGRPSGDQASGIVVQELARAIGAARKDGQILRAAILNGIERANAEVLDRGLGSAATLAVVEIQGQTVRPFHIGDCSIIVCGQRGRLRLQTVAHSPVGFAVEAGLMDESEAMHHEDRHLVSNVIGASDMRIEIGAMLELARHDTLVVASDGLLDNLHLEEIIAEMRCGRLSEAAARLAGRATRRMLDPREGTPSKPDDLTFILFRRRAPRG